jgi:hypothetical protein
MRFSGSVEKFYRETFLTALAGQSFGEKNDPEIIYRSKIKENATVIRGRMGQVNRSRDHRTNYGFVSLAAPLATWFY